MQQSTNPTGFLHFRQAHRSAGARLASLPAVTMVAAAAPLATPLLDRPT
jgi:hypothetical protein